MAVLGLYTSALVCIRRAEPLLENNTKKVWDFLCDFVFLFARRDFGSTSCDGGGIQRTHTGLGAISSSPSRHKIRKYDYYIIIIMQYKQLPARREIRARRANRARRAICIW